MDEVTESVFADGNFMDADGIDGIFLKESFLKFFELRDQVVHADEVSKLSRHDVCLRSSVCAGRTQSLDSRQRQN